MQLESKVDLVPNLVRGHRRDGRCRYDKAAKRELVRRVLEPGVSLAGTALAHGINANLLRKWVIQMSGRLRRTSRTRVISTTSALLPVQVDGTRAASAIERTAGYVEISVAGGTVRIYGRIEAEALRTVLDCLAARA